MGDEAFKREKQVERPANPDKGRIKSLGIKYGILAGALASALVFSSVSCTSLLCARFDSPKQFYKSAYDPKPEDMGELGKCKEGMQKFAELLGSEDVLLRKYAIKSFAIAAEKNPESATPYLAGLLEDTNPLVRGGAALAFGSANLSRDAVARYDDIIYKFRDLLKDEKPEVRLAAAEALGNAAARVDISRYDGVLGSLGNLAGYEEKASSEDALIASHKAAEALWRAAEKNPDVLLPRLKGLLEKGSADMAMRLKTESSEAIKRNPGLFIPFFAELIKNEDQKVARSAEEALKSGCYDSKKPQDLAAPLLNLLDDSNAAVKSTALILLLNISELHVYVQEDSMGFEQYQIYYPAVDLSKYKGAIEKIGKLLGDENSRVRSLAADVLASASRTRDIDRFGIRGVRYQRYSGIDLSKYPGIIDALGRLLLDGDPLVRASAAEALGSVCGKTDLGKYPVIVERLGKLLNDENPDVRKNAARALGYAAEKVDLSKYPGIISRLESLHKNEDNPKDEYGFASKSSSVALAYVAQKNPEEILPHLGEIFRNEKMLDVEVPLAEAVAKNPDTLLKHVSEFLGDSNKYAVMCSMEVLELAAQENPKKIVPYLGELLSNASPAIRANASKVIGDLPTKQNDEGKYAGPDIAQEYERIPGKLVELLKDENAKVVENAIYALSEIIARNPGKSAPQICSLLKDESRVKSKNAAYALGKAAIKNPSGVVPFLADALADKNPAARENGALALSVAANREDLGGMTHTLLVLFKDPDAKVRASAAKALGTIAANMYTSRYVCFDHYPYSCETIPDGGERTYTINLRKYGGVIEGFGALLNDPDAQVKKNALLALKGIASQLYPKTYGEGVSHIDFREYGGLIQKINELRGDQDSEVGKIATETLRQIKKNLRGLGVHY